MNKFIIITMIMTATAVGVTAGDPIATVIALEGGGTATSADGQIRELALKLPLFMNDKIITDSNSKVQIKFDDDSVVSQGEKSEMLIDEYLYSPVKEESSCSLKFAKGVFRVLTGKITDMNPDRFKVRTRMATIGIRGCEVGFRLTQQGEDVYILGLPEGKSILVQKVLLPGEILRSGAASLEQVLNIVNEGMVVSIAEGVGLLEREISPDEARQILIESSVNMGSTGTGDQDSSDIVDGVDNIDSDVNAIQETVNVAASSLNEENQLASLTEQADESQQAPPLRGSWSDWQDMTVEELEAQAESLKYTEPTTPPVTDPPQVSTNPPAEPPPTDPGPPVLVGGHPELTCWEWGIWEDGSAFYAANGYMGRRFLASSEIQEIIGGATEYNLSGSGMAGAVLKNGPNMALVEGSCNMAVQLGGESGNAWQGSFRLNNSPDPDSLDFEAAGNITAGGLSGMVVENTLPYSMKVGGATFQKSSITSENIEGALIGEGTIIYGTAGEFHIKHNNGAATADGAFGADLY